MSRVSSTVFLLGRTPAKTISPSQAFLNETIIFESVKETMEAMVVSGATSVTVLNVSRPAVYVKQYSVLVRRVSNGG